MKQVSVPTLSPASEDSARPPRGLVCLGLSVTAGALGFAGSPGIDLWPFAWIALVPMLFVVERVATTRRAFLFAWVTGFVTNVGGFYWFAPMLRRFAHVPGAAAFAVLLALCAYQGLVFALTGAIVRTVRRRTALPMALLAPLAMVTFELTLPMEFPFNIAITQAWQHHVIQVADLTGPLGVTALLTMVNGAAYDLLVAPRRRLAAALIAAGVLVAALAYGHLRIEQVETARASAPALRVGIVQPNLGFHEKGPDRMLRAPAQLLALQAESVRLEALGAELIVWPECAYPYDLPRDIAADRPPFDSERIRTGFERPLIFGSLTFALKPFGTPNYPYNSALMLSSDGRITGRFDKIHLVFGSEYTPWRDTIPFLNRMMPTSASQHTPGDRVTTLPLPASDGPAWRLGPTICLEDTLPGLSRRLSSLHPHLLVNLTNDAWFGDTTEPWQHLALSVFRAVESRTDLVRCANSGVSAFVDAAGRVYAKTYAIDPTAQPREADGLVASVRLIEGGHTPYATVGDLFGYLCVAAVLHLWIIAPWLARRLACRRSPPTPPVAGPSAPL